MAVSVKLKKAFDWFRPEEKFLLAFSLCCLAIFYFMKPDGTDLVKFALLEMDAFDTSYGLFGLSFFLFIYYYACLSYVKLLYRSITAKNSGRRFADNITGGKLLDFAKKTVRFAAFLIILLAAFSCSLLVLEAITQSVQARTINAAVFEWDRVIFGVYPLVWFQSDYNYLKPLFDLATPAIIYAFVALTAAMCFSLAIFFRKPEISAGMIVSFFAAYVFGMIFWYCVPVNSPNNYFLSQNPQIDGYHPNSQVLDFEKAMRDAQKEVTPISTFPSAHVMWGMQLVYFWAVYNRKTLFIFVPWFLLMALGTVFLAQHYAVDVLLAFPLGILSIAIGRCFASRSVHAAAA